MPFEPCGGLHSCLVSFPLQTIPILLIFKSDAFSFTCFVLWNRMFCKELYLYAIMLQHITQQTLNTARNQDIVKNINLFSTY